LTSRLQSFETEVLTQEENLTPKTSHVPNPQAYQEFMRPLRLKRSDDRTQAIPLRK
jgi:hypothetical protein